MSSPIQVFLEYKIKHDKKEEYELYMPKLLQQLADYEADEIDWYEAADQDYLYVEMFKLPTMSHYYAMKESRSKKDHPLFGELDTFIEGGLHKLHCWAFLQKNH